MLKDNIIQIQEQLKKVNGGTIILAATKTVPPEIVNSIFEYGIKDIGENKVQELLEKYDRLDKRFNLHFIGRLQKNKVKYIIDKVCLIHSVDNMELAEEINKQAQKKALTANILVQINIGKDIDKGGIFLEDAEDFIENLKALQNLKVRGLMTVLPLNCKSEELYLQLKEFYDKIKEKNNLDILSMGMSGDYLAAASCGATIVRLGRALFGERKY